MAAEMDKVRVQDMHEVRDSKGRVETAAVEIKYVTLHLIVRTRLLFAMIASYGETDRGLILRFAAIARLGCGLSKSWGSNRFGSDRCFECDQMV